MTLTTFNRMYQHYQDAWDLEMRLWKSNTTHSELYEKSQHEQEWF